MPAKHPEPAPQNPNPTFVDLDREVWLIKAADVFRTLIKQVTGREVPPFRVSMGFGGVHYERGVAANTYSRHASPKDGISQVFISPESDDIIDILTSLLHEMIHVLLDHEDNPGWRRHDGEFMKICRLLGLTAPYTVSLPDVSLGAEMLVIAEELGHFPHSALEVRKAIKVEGLLPVQGVQPGGMITLSVAGNPQKNRWVSVQCPHHGRPWRASRKALTEGLPFCGVKDDEGKPCLTEMVAKD